MNRTIRVVALFVSGTILLSFVVLVVNQTAQVVQLATTLNPTLGKVTLVVLLATYGVVDRRAGGADPPPAEPAHAAGE